MATPAEAAAAVCKRDFTALCLRKATRSSLSMTGGNHILSQFYKGRGASVAREFRAKNAKGAKSKKEEELEEPELKKRRGTRWLPRGANCIILLAHRAARIVNHASSRPYFRSSGHEIAAKITT